MNVVCLDLEGVLIPEIWLELAEKTQIEELRLTTREVSDYDLLMRGRIRILREHGIKIGDIQDVVATMDPLEGAVDFLDSLRSLTQVIILSDTFMESAKPLFAKLHWPTVFCNNLIIDEEGNVTDYRMRLQDGKRKAIRAMKSLNFTTFAAGDSYNDIAMIKEADRGCLFRAPDNILNEFPELTIARTYDEFLSYIRKELEI